MLGSADLFTWSGRKEALRGSTGEANEGNADVVDEKEGVAGVKSTSSGGMGLFAKFGFLVVIAAAVGWFVKSRKGGHRYALLG